MHLKHSVDFTDTRLAMIARKGGVDSLIEFRGSFLELLVVAIAIALAINLLAGVISTAVGTTWIILISGALIIVSCIILVVRATPRVNRRFMLRGIVPLTKEQNVVSIDRYRFSREIYDSFRALLYENKAIEKMWRNCKLDFNHSQDRTLTRPRSRKLYQVRN